MAQEITLPVKLLLENLLEITKEMRSQLSTLKVDSSGYKKLDGVITDIEKRILQLQVTSSRPFIDAKQFTAVSKGIIGIEDDLTKIRIEAGKIKFSDLSLNGALKAKLQEFDAEIKAINDLLKLVKDSAKNTFFETDIGKAWKLNHADDVGKTFTLITSKIETEIAKLEVALKRAEEAYADYLERLAAKRRLLEFIKNGHGLTKENLGEDIYNLIFDKNSNFKSGGRTALQTWLEELFKLDPAKIKELTKDAGKRVQEAFAEALGKVETTLKLERSRINANIKNENTSTNNGQSYALDIVEKQTALNAERAAKESINETNIKLAKTEEDLMNSSRRAKLDREAYILALVRTANELLQMGSSCDAARTQLDLLNLTVDTGRAKLASLDQATSKLLGISNFVNRYVGAYAIIRKVSTAIRNAFLNIKELDLVITNIAVVTNMSLEDLWNKVGQYTLMALEYGVTTKDVYSVSLLFYQLGLQTSQVMDLTTETLKMAKIAGMDYTEATNAMTVAVRAFNIEMDNAQQVTDTYSALAAKFAVSSAEIANAMEKTASSAANVGMSIQSTSAFISVMEQTTRESALNIGSALKSIISRYGEMKASPSKLINVDGEDVAFNKVDTALLSVGISIKDTVGLFRDFDDVIMELALKWNTLDNNTQRYIATVMAGNRQLSRFIALVSNYDELKRAMATANEAENASIVQVAKTMDSLESKANLLKNAFSLIYLDLHVEKGLKNMYDWLTRILLTIGKLGVLKGAIPTLVNLIGFGTGTKSLIRNLQDSIQAKKLKIEADNSEALNKIDEVKLRAEELLIAHVTAEVDDTQLKDLENRVNLLNTNINVLATTGQLVSTNDFYTILRLALLNGSLSTAAGRAQTLQLMGVLPETERYVQMDELMSHFDSTAASVEALKAAFDGTTAAVTAHTTAQSSADAVTLAHTLAINNDTIATETHSLAEQSGALTTTTYTLAILTTTTVIEGTTPALEGTNLVLALTSGVVGEMGVLALVAGTELTNLDVSTGLATRTTLTTTTLIVSASLEIKNLGNSANLTSLQLKLVGNTGGSTGGIIEGIKDKTGINFSSSNTALMRSLGMVSSIARIAGTAITALGASILDVSTSNTEWSKVWAGVGNGLSMAGTGATIGMAAGPWGAIVGAIGGFLFGGLSAIIDGANMTILERISLALAEAKTKSDNALKDSAKALDISSSLDNLKILKNAMYNSNEDMQKYTDAMNTLADSYPALISTYDSMGNAVIDLLQAESYLLLVRLASAKSARESAEADAYTRRLLLASLLGLLNTTHATTRQATTWERFAMGLGGYTGTTYTMAATLEDREKMVNEALKANASVLGISDTTTMRDYLNIVDKNRALTEEDFDALAERLIAQIEGITNSFNILNLSVAKTNVTELLLSTLDTSNNIKREDKLKISINSIFSTLVANGLENAAQQIEGVSDASDWANKDKEAFNEKNKELVENLLKTISNWSSNILDQFISDMESLDSYLSVDEIFTKYNITDSELIQEIIDAFINDNLANRDRILKLIWNEDQTFNSDALGAIELLNNKYDIVNISDLFTADEDGASAIISKYADYFASQLLQINLLAENGYTVLANTRLDKLNAIANQLAKNPDLLNELFSTITSIDFSDYDSITSASKQIGEYGTSKGIDVSDITKILNEAANELIFNVNTLAQNLSDSIINAAKDIDSVLGANKSGIDLSKALDELQNLNAGKSAEDAFNFDQVFRFDASLGKYVYTVNGLKEAISLVEGDLNDKVIQLRKMQKLYQESLSGINTKDNFEDADTLLANIVGYENWDTQTLSLYEGLANDFIKATNDTEQTWDNFIKYVLERKESGDKAAEIAELLLAAYNANKPSQLFQNIDWASLALKTDYSGTNKELMQLLAIELGLMDERTGEWVRDKARSWETVVDEYLDLLYGEGDSTAKRVAKAKINDDILKEEISNYQTTLSEILNSGSGKISLASLELARTLGIDISEIGLSADKTISTALKFLDELAKHIGEAGYTLELYNADAKSVLDKTLFSKKRGYLKTILDAVAGTFDSSAFENLANSFGKTLNDLINPETGELNALLAGHFTYNAMTNSYDVQGTFESFVDALANTLNITIDTSTKEYINALSTWNNGLIEKRKEIKENIIKELNAFSSADIASELNISWLLEILGKNLPEVLYQYGGVLKDGILSFTQDANIAEMFSSIVELVKNIEDSTLLLSEDEIANLQDAIVSMLSDVVSLVNTGLEGKLTHTLFTNLSLYATQNGIGPLGYTETYEGIQLTEDGFAELYTHLSKVDKKLAKTLLPNITKMSKLYKTLGDVLKAYLEATKNASNALKQVLEDLTSSMLRNPENFNLMNSELPPELLIGENYYSSLSKGMQVILSMTKEGKASFSDFYALMLSIINNTLNMEDRQYALDLLLLSRAYYFDDNGTPMIDVKAMGLSTLDSAQQLYQMMSNAYDSIRQASQLELKIFDELRYGAESLESAEIVKDGTVNIDKIKLIIESKTLLGENIKLLLESIIVNNRSLYEMLNDPNLQPDDESIRDKLIRILSDTNFTYEDFDEEAADVFTLAGLKGTIKLDSSTGKITFEEDLSKTDASLVYKDGDLTFNDYNEWVEWSLAKQLKSFTPTIENEEIIGGSYQIDGGYTVEVLLKDGIVTYSLNVPGVGLIECENLDQLDAAISLLVTSLTTGDKTIESAPTTYKVSHNGITVEVDYSSGSVTLVSGNTPTNIDDAQWYASIELAAKGKIEEETKSVKTNEPINVETSNINIALAEGYTAKLTTSPVELSDSVNVAANSININKSQDFNIVGIDTIWNSVTLTHEYEDPFVATVLELLIKLGNKFKKPDGSTIWDVLNTIDTKDDVKFAATVIELLILQGTDFVDPDGNNIWLKLYSINTKDNEQFIATVIDLLIQTGKHFVAPDGSNIWDLIKNIDTKQYPLFEAFVQALVTKPGTKDGTEINNDNGSPIWDLVKEEPETAFNFIAYVASLTTQEDTSNFKNDKGETFWQTVEMNKTKDGFSFEALISILTFAGNAIALAKAKSGPSLEDLSIESSYHSSEAIEYVQDVKLTYNVEDDKTAEDIIAARSKLWNNLDLRYSRYKEDGFYGLEYWDSLDSRTYKNGYSDVNNLGWHIADNSKMASYIDSLANLVATGKALGEVDFTNLETLLEMNIKGEPGNKIKEIYDAATTNATDFSSNVESLKELSGIEFKAEALSTYSEAISKIATALQALNSIEWDKIINGLNSLDSELISKEPIKEPIELEPNGNVNLNSRPYISPELMKKAGWLDFDGDYATLFSNTMTSSVESEILVTVGVTPITEDGRVLSPEALDSYVYDYLFGNGTNTAEDIIELDKKGLNILIDIQEGSSQEDIEAMDNKLIAIHEELEQIYNDPLLPEIDSSELDKLVITLTSILNLINTISSSLINLNTSGDGSVTGNALAEGNSLNEGNIALAAGRKTLMGELGPEMYVSNGHYYIAGQGGAEMVDLPEDAIVFNHILTRSLLKNGKATRGKAIVNERVATGMAHAAGSGPDWNKFSSWSDANAAIATALEHISRSASDSYWQEQNKKAAELWKREYVKYLADLLEAANKLLQAAEALTDAAENTELAAKELVKAVKDSNRLHTGYKRVNSDGAVTASSANNGMYKTTTPTQTWGTTQVDNDSYFAKTMKQLYGAINGASVDVEKIKQLVSSVITKLLEVGFESIDLSSDDFKELDASTKSLMQEYIKRPDASYRDFVRLYGEKAGYTVQEFNEQYFAAWQKDNDIFGASSEMKDAARNLSFFANGAVGGSAEDWTTLFGNATSITDLVDAGIIDWNAKLGQFVVTSMEKLQEFDTNLDIEQFQDIIADGLRTTMSNMMDLVSKGASGSLSHEELGQLNGYLETYNLPDISKNMISETADGLKVSNEYLFHFYDQLKKVDALQARIAFKLLKQSLEESNDNFKTMDRLLGHMSELLKKIQDTSKYSDEKILLYQEELELCLEIAAVRATTEDNSMNFLDLEIPDGMNNPLNYISNWATFIKDYRQAAEEGGAIDFKEMYNAMNHMSNLASIVGKPLDFLGNQLDGSAEKIHAAMMKLVGSLGFDSEGNYGVLLDKFAADFTNGVDGFAASAKEGLKTMAESLIKILDGLIAMFEAIAAMESFKGADIDLSGTLDFKEIFIDTENLEKAILYTDAYTKCAQEMSEKLGDNSILAQTFENIKVNGYSLKAIIEDAITGVKSIDISSLDLTAIMSKLFEGLSTDDYSKTDIANSLNDWFAGIKLSEATTVDLGDVVLTTNGKIVKGPNSTFITPGGQTFGTVDEAITAAALEDFKTGKEATDAKVELTAETDITITSSALVTVTADTAEASKSVDSLALQINSISTSIDVDLDTTLAYKDLNKLIEDIEAKTPSVDVTVSKATTEAETENNESSATGNAMAGGTKETLMGELGPELYVTNGHYYVAGQNGAEFVKLPKDAIVFNHLLTLKLLNTGSSGRGKPITNERNAVSLARGTTGPAAANVQETLNVLYELRAMWQTLADMSVKDLAGLGASKDSSDGGDSSKPASTWLALVERWYDLLQKIARLEKEINYQEALRNKLESDRVPNGKEYFDTLVLSLDNLKQQALAHKELAESLEDYFNQRREELNKRKSPFAKFYTFDEGGQLKYSPGAFDKLSDIVALDEWGRPKYTPQQQYDLMKSYGFESYMKYDNSGNPIDLSEEGWQLLAVQAVWERMEAELKEMQTLYDSKEEQKVKYLDSINDANKLLLQMVDNQIDLEKLVISAIEERELAVIDALSDERLALADSTNAYIKGLLDSLDKERKMREKNDSDLELSKLLSRLSMLQRGGGSAAEIANLQREISDKQTDMYFDAQSQQIEAIQDASDLQLEKLQTQIDLMSESLAYAKENGLLWAEATEIMKQNPEVIALFITDNSPDFASQSVAALTEELRKILFSAEQFASYYDYIESLKEGKTPLNNTLFDLNTAINDGFEIVVANDENKEKLAYEELKKLREEEAQRWEVELEQRKADEKAQLNAAALAHENEMYDLYGAALGMSRIKWDELRAKGRITDESLQEKYNIDGITQKILELQMDMYQEMLRNKDNPLYSYWSNLQMAETQDQIEALEALRDKLRFEAYAKELGYTKRYAHGGLVNYTGLAMVHGSDARPEAFLNADEVKVWKEDILGSSSHSLTSQMLEMLSLYEKFNSTISSTYHNNSEGINIERVDVNMNVALLANDYDARRAGREVMNEILNIANKSSSGNRVGR